MCWRYVKEHTVERAVPNGTGSHNMGPTLDKKAYPILCDNEAIVHSLTSGTSCSPDVMDLLCRLFLCAAKFNFTASVKHVPGIHNTIADSLSRFQIQVFRLAAPAAETHPTTPAQMPLQNMKFILHNSLATNTRASYNSDSLFLTVKSLDPPKKIWETMKVFHGVREARFDV